MVILLRCISLFTFYNKVILHWLNDDKQKQSDRNFTANANSGYFLYHRLFDDYHCVLGLSKFALQKAHRTCFLRCFEWFSWLCWSLFRFCRKWMAMLISIIFNNVQLFGINVLVGCNFISIVCHCWSRWFFKRFAIRSHDMLDFTVNFNSNSALNELLRPWRW